MENDLEPSDALPQFLRGPFDGWPLAGLALVVVVAVLLVWWWVRIYRVAPQRLRERLIAGLCVYPVVLVVLILHVNVATGVGLALLGEASAALLLIVASTLCRGGPPGYYTDSDGHVRWWDGERWLE